MVTFAQAQERAERWVNGEVPPAFHREVRVREFALGFVAWAEDREGGGPVGEGSRSRLVIARDSGETTLWPGLPVGEVIRRYEEEYGAAAEAGYEAAEPPQRIDLEATSFLLTPPEWLQEAADAMGLGGRKGAGDGGDGASGTASGTGSVSAAGSGSGGSDSDGSGTASGAAVEAGAGTGARAGSTSDGQSAVADAGGASADARADVSVNAGPEPDRDPAPSAADDTPWAAADTTAGGNGEDRSVALPQTVFAPPLAGSDDEDTPSTPQVRPDAKTELLHRGSQLPRTKISPTLPPPSPDVPGQSGAGGPGGLPPMPPSPPPMPPMPPGVPPAPPAPSMPSSPSTAPSALRDLPPPTGAPIADVPPPPGVLPPAPPAPPSEGRPGGGVHAAATMLADGSSMPGSTGGPPPPPGTPGIPGAGRDGGRPAPEAVAAAETQKADARPADGPPAPGPGATGAPGGGLGPGALTPIRAHETPMG
ncbi:hypothetical protein ACFXO2_29565, partial [Streptomyces sp. NPDC059152]